MMQKQAVRKHIWVGTLGLLLALSLSSCLGTTNEHLANMDSNTEKLAKEVEAYREYVQSVSEEMKRLNATLESFQKMSAQLFQLFMEALTHREPAPTTPEISDYFDPTPIPSPPPPEAPSITTQSTPVQEESR